MTGGILLCGANGSGKTTLGKELSKALHHKYIDVEDYSFLESQVPYSKPRPRDQVRLSILRDIEKYRYFILSAVNGDMGNEINAMYRCVIYLSAPLALRLKRIRQRSYEEFGERVQIGGDMYDQEQRFLAFVAARSMKKTDMWIQTLSCPVIYADGTRDIQEHVKWLLSNYAAILEKR